jgi:hypothetical protein
MECSYGSSHKGMTVLEIYPSSAQVALLSMSFILFNAALVGAIAAAAIMRHVRVERIERELLALVAARTVKAPHSDGLPATAPLPSIIPVQSSPIIIRSADIDPETSLTVLHNADPTPKAAPSSGGGAAH